VPLPRDAWTVSASASNATEPPERVLDGDPATRWSTGRGMQAGDWFQVDLGSARTFNQVVLDTTASSGDSPRGYQLFVSDDGTNWGQPIATGPGSPVIRALIPQVTARYLRVVNQGSAGNWWSLHELNVLGPADAASSPARSHGGFSEDRRAARRHAAPRRVQLGPLRRDLRRAVGRLHLHLPPAVRRRRDLHDPPRLIRRGAPTPGGLRIH
jgi:hypothetical protein